MKRLLLGFLVLVFTASLASAQESATQQQINKLSGQVQDLIDAQALEGKRLDALEKKINDLADKVSTPQVNDSASRDDLKKLAEQVKEIDQKRQDDRELILKEIKKLGRVAAAGAPAPNNSKPADDPAPAGPQTGHPYTIAAGDTLSAIAKAYRDQGIKVSTQDILKANPGLDPTKLYVGKKIFIPDPDAK